MKLILLTGSAVAALAMAAPGAMAEQPTGFYIGGDLGINYKSDQKLKSDNDIATGFGPYQYNLSTHDANFGVLGRLGYRFNEHWRVEGELGYRPGSVDRMVGPRTYFPGDSTANRAPDSAICGTVTATTCTGPHGHMNQTSAFANVIRDFAPDYRFHPFLGLGIGAVNASTSVNGIMSRTGQTITISGNKVEPAVQGIAGVAYALNSRTTLEITYRLMGVNKMRYNSSVSALPSGAATVTAEDTAARARMEEAFTSGTINNPGGFSGDFTNQTVTIGLRYTFGTPPAPPPRADDGAAAPAAGDGAPAAPAAAGHDDRSRRRRADRRKGLHGLFPLRPVEPDQGRRSRCPRRRRLHQDRPGFEGHGHRLHRYLGLGRLQHEAVGTPRQVDRQGPGGRRCRQVEAVAGLEGQDRPGRADRRWRQGTGQPPLDHRHPVLSVDILNIKSPAGSPAGLFVFVHRCTQMHTDLGLALKRAQRFNSMRYAPGLP